MGVKYNYVTKEAMLKAIEEGKKIEWEELPDNFKKDGDIALAAFNREGASVLNNFEKGFIDNKKGFLEHPSVELYDYLKAELQSDIDVISAVKDGVESYYRHLVAMNNWNLPGPSLHDEKGLKAEADYNRFNELYDKAMLMNMMDEKEKSEKSNTDSNNLVM